VIPSTVEYRPAGFEHVDALGVFLLDLTVVVALVEEPEELEVDGIEKAVGDGVFASGLCVEDYFAGFEAGEVDVEHLTEDGDGVGGDAAAYDEIEAAGFAGGCSLEDVVGDRRAVDSFTAEAGGEGEVDAAKDDAGELGGLLSGIGHGFELVEGRDGFEVEEEVCFFLFLFGVDLVDGFGEFAEGVGALDHGCDDVVNADLFAFDEIAHGLAAAYLEAELEVCFSADFDQAEEFVDAGALCFEFGFDCHIAELFFAQLEELQHLAFASIHYFPRNKL
jgi:hypothetical protein